MTDTCGRGGSIISDLLCNHGSLIRKENIITPVRSQEQANALSKLGVKVVRIDLSDEKDVVDTISQNNGTITSHIRSSELA